MKKETLKITVCTGTTCYVLGGSHYLMLKQELPGEILARISLEGSPCMGICQEQDGQKKTPCLKIGETVFSGLALDEVIKEITARLGEDNETQI